MAFVFHPEPVDASVTFDVSQCDRSDVFEAAIEIIDKGLLNPVGLKASSAPWKVEDSSCSASTGPARISGKHPARDSSS